MQPQLNARWLALDGASNHSGVSRRQIQIWDERGFIRSANITMPGATRGRRVYDRESIDTYIESFIGAPPSKIVMHENRKAAR